MFRSRFVRFVMTGGIAAAVNLASRYVLNFWMSFSPAVIAAYCLGMMTAYILNRLFVFERSGRHAADEMWRFGVVNLFAAAQVWVISVGLGEYVFPALRVTFHPLEIAHLLGVAFPIFSSYLGHKHFSFAKETEPGAQ